VSGVSQEGKTGYILVNWKGEAQGVTLELPKQDGPVFLVTAPERKQLPAERVALRPNQGYHSCAKCRATEAGMSISGKARALFVDLAHGPTKQPGAKGSRSEIGSKARVSLGFVPTRGQ
jgi:hypothetical protein